MKQPDFLCVDPNSHELKVDDFFLVDKVKNEWCQSDHGTLKLTLSQEIVD